MEHYASLDVSLKEISICVVDEDVGTVAGGTCTVTAGLAGSRQLPLRCFRA